MPALDAYSACKTKRRGGRRQYTVRSISAELDKALRGKARAQGVSINQAAIEALASGVGLGAPRSTYADLDVVVGSWVED